MAFNPDNDNTLISLLTSSISGVTYMFTQINIYDAGIPNIFLQTISLVAGLVAICSGIIAIRKNLKDK